MHHSAVYKINHCTANDSSVLQDLLTQLVAANAIDAKAFYPELPTDILLPILDNHYKEYGAGIGLVENEQGDIIGMAGLQFLQDTELFEAVCYLLPDYTAQFPNVLSTVVDTAFHDLGLDKLCARTVTMSLADMQYREAGFTYVDERAFSDDGMGQIWNYYELENDANMVDAEQLAFDDSDWDSLF